MLPVGNTNNTSDWKLTAYGSRRNRAALSLPPLLGCAGLVYLFGPEFLPFRAPAAVVAMIAASFILTLWWLSTYRPYVRAGFSQEVRRAYRNLVGLGLLVAGVSMPLGPYGLACIGAYVGYLAAFTYVQMNWRDSE